MADPNHLNILNQGVDVWNDWRQNFPNISPDLRGVDLYDANLAAIDLRGCNLMGAYLVEARLSKALLDRASLIDGKLMGVRLAEASLIEVDFSRADMTWADLSGSILQYARLKSSNLTAARFDLADLQGADLSGSWLVMASLVKTKLIGADLTGCNVYGCSVWDAEMDLTTKQSNLTITFPGETVITLDNLEVAQFIYSLLNNQSIRNAIDTITSKVVLILGRFTTGRKMVLDALRFELHKLNYLPIIFDFDIPASRDITETVSLLARMARFIIADLTDAKSLPQELSVIIPDLPSVPVQPLLSSNDSAYSMFEHWQRFPWVLPVYRYESDKELIGSLNMQIIRPAEQRVLEMRKRV